MNINPKIFILLGSILLIVGGFYAFSIFSDREFVTPGPVTVIPPSLQNDELKCLSKDEYVDYPLDLNSNPFLKIPKEYPVTISVRDSDTGVEKSSFVIENIRSNYRPIEIHKCSVYTTKTFNYNKSRIAAGQWDEDYRVEFWKYSYDGSGEKKILLLENSLGAFTSYFSTDFRVSFNEKYTSLTKGYLGRDDYSLIIKDLNTLEDPFILSLQEIISKDESIFGDIGLNWWSSDSRYFWANIFQAADVLAFIRVDTTDWTWELFPAPIGTMGGDALNPDLGLVTYDVGAPWTADPDFEASYQQRMEREGNLSHFYVYNLITKQQILLETTPDHNWSFRPWWISENELQYHAPPDGEIKVYKVGE